jgi:FMN phosphatase YigB (HAD superfamily)
VAALHRLQSRFRLAIISNTDDDLFAGTAPHLQVKFDQAITAEQAGAYKPSLAPFRLALERLGLPTEQVLHAGQSVYHDVVTRQVPRLSYGFGAPPRLRRHPRRGRQARAGSSRPARPGSLAVA